jgi:tRNA-modifying protein YgfZ
MSKLRRTDDPLQKNWLAPRWGWIIYEEAGRESRVRMESKVYVLRDRGVIEVAGADAAGFLQRLITNSVLDIPKGEGRYAGLLTPQGKLMFDFFAVPLPEGPDVGYLIDCARAQGGDLSKRLNLHKMRAKILIADKSEEFAVAAVLGGEAPTGVEGLIYRDTRAPGMGLRIIAPREALARFEDASEAAYEAHRIAQGVPKAGIDFVYGDAFVHDINLDLMNGVDFKKGCYVGQEVVSRVHFRKSARKRIAKIHFDGPAPACGTPIMAGNTSIGQIGSTSDAEGLAMLRLDRFEEARAAGAAMKAGDVAVAVTVPK